MKIITLDHKTNAKLTLPDGTVVICSFIRRCDPDTRLSLVRIGTLVADFKVNWEWPITDDCVAVCLAAWGRNTYTQLPGSVRIGFRDDANTILIERTVRHEQRSTDEAEGGEGSLGIGRQGR